MSRRVGGMVPVPVDLNLSREDEMKSNSEHQKRANTTDQKFADNDEHIHEADKRHLKESEQHPNLIPTKGAKSRIDQEKQDDGD